MRRVLIAIVLLSAGCRPHEAARPAASPGLGVSDDELAAHTRYQRDYMALFRRHWEELHAVGDDDPNLVVRDRKAFEARVAEVVARQVPVMKALQDRVPLKGEKAELVNEAIGGIFHFQDAALNFNLVIARDEAREALILAALQGP